MLLWGTTVIICCLAISRASDFGPSPQPRGASHVGTLGYIYIYFYYLYIENHTGMYASIHKYVYSIYIYMYYYMIYLHRSYVYYIRRHKEAWRFPRLFFFASQMVSLVSMQSIGLLNLDRRTQDPFFPCWFPVFLMVSMTIKLIN